MYIVDDQFRLYIFMLVELSDTLSPMHIADVFFFDYVLCVSQGQTLRGRFKSHSEIAALLSAFGGFSYLIMGIRVIDLGTSQLQHYLVRWAALVTW